MKSTTAAKALFESGETLISKTSLKRTFGKDAKAIPERQYDTIQRELGKLYQKKAEVEKQVELAKTAKTLSRTVKQTKDMIDKANEIAKGFHSGYSMGDLVEVVIYDNHVKGLTMARHDTREEYAKSSKWRAKHGHLCIYLTRKELEGLQYKSGKGWCFGDKVLTESGSKRDYNVELI